MSDDRMHCSTVYLCTTNKDGKHTYTEHQVWDRGLFLSTRMAEAQELAITVASIPRSAYLAEREPPNRRAS